MANTEGLSDEAMSSLLAMPSSEEEKLQRQHKNVAAVPVGRMKPPSFRCSLARREQMMELGEGVAPAAKVIRSSKAPKVNSASSKKKNYGQACAVEIDDPEQISFVILMTLTASRLLHESLVSSNAIDITANCMRQQQEDFHHLTSPHWAR